MDDITFWNRVAESSPVIVLLLLGALVGGGRLGWRIMSELLRRLDAKDERFEAANTRMVQAMHENTEALRELIAQAKGR